MTDRTPAQPTDSRDLSRNDPGSASPPKPIQLSLPQIMGGALAAATAAALGSRLGVAGTVVGAALASTIMAIGGTAYTASLRSTQRGMRSAWHRVARRGHPGRDDHRPAVPSAATIGATPVTDVHASDDGAAAEPDVRPEPGRRRIRPIWVLAGAVGVFVLAGVLITGLEVLTGRGLDGSPQTTVEQVVGGGVGPDTPPAEPTTEPSATTSSAPATEHPTGTAPADPTASTSQAPSSPASTEPPVIPSATSSDDPPTG